MELTGNLVQGSKLSPSLCPQQENQRNVVKNERPPNWEIINLLNPPKGSVFAWGEDIYNPDNVEVFEDVQFHESIHGQRQGNQIENWWNRYLTDKQFRLEEELIAYAEQCKYIKDKYGTKVCESILEESAINLSTHYGLDLSYGVAHSKIRNKMKSL